MPLHRIFHPCQLPGVHWRMSQMRTFTCASTSSFCNKLARLHMANNFPNGKFGFHCATYNGDLPQHNTWHDSWEAFFANGLRHVLRIREERAGPDRELDALPPNLFDKVIPGLIRPLETEGRKLKPSLVHGDLWCGNACVVRGSGEDLVYDPAAFWGHHESSL
ncbi:Fructosamine/Ketosamine-3-kinase [Cladorrhinum sp. PSN332]|nr:Fructosamine/Ketosamine-3-kinase [Cladorrhinum sp. PSN332]